MGRSVEMKMGNSKRFKVLMRDNFKCRYCGKCGDEKILEVDHILPRSRGGSNVLDNLVTACFECNRGKRDKLILETTALEVEIGELAKKAAEAYAKKKQEDDSVRVFINYFLENAPHEHQLNGYELRMFKEMVKRFEPSLILKAVDIAIEKYIPQTATDRDYYLAIKKIGGICFNKSKAVANG